jgi:hypothetical protein
VLLNVTESRSVPIVITENERGLIHAECNRGLSVDLAIPSESASRAVGQRALAAQVTHIERQTRFNSTLLRAVVSTGPATAHFTSPIFEFFLEISGDAFADQPIAPFGTAAMVRQT